MKKAFAIICTGILVVIFSFLLIRIIQSFFTIYFYYDYVIWCGKEEKEYIEEETGFIEIKSNIATFRNSYNDSEIISLLNGFPSIFTKETIIGGYEISEYIKERSNKFEAMVKCSLPYIVVCIVIYIIYYKKLLPILTEE